MVLQRAFINGFLIYFGIALYFLIIEYLGFADEFFMRIVNLFIVTYGVNRTIEKNYKDGIVRYNKNLFSGIITSFTGCALSVISLFFYILYKGGNEYLQTLSRGFLVKKENLNVFYYCGGLFFECIASSTLITFLLMLIWKKKFQKVKNKNQIKSQL